MVVEFHGHSSKDFIVWGFCIIGVFAFWDTLSFRALCLLGLSALPGTLPLEKSSLADFLHKWGLCFPGYFALWGLWATFSSGNFVLNAFHFGALCPFGQSGTLCLLGYFSFSSNLPFWLFCSFRVASRSFGKFYFWVT